jgi:sulfur-oxidizing protein SoxA
MKPIRAIAVAALLVVAAEAAVPLVAAEIPETQRRSGYSFMTPYTQAMENDDTSNPGMLWVLDGEALWNAKAGSDGKACADCHGDARASMKGVAARYPAFDQAQGRPVNLEQRINLCRANHQQATPLAYESHDLLALTAFVAEQSRGAPIASPSDPQLAPFLRDRRSRRDSQPAIRFTVWNGNRLAHCSGACATA